MILRRKNIKELGDKPKRQKYRGQEMSSQNMTQDHNQHTYANHPIMHIFNPGVGGSQVLLRLF